LAEPNRHIGILEFFPPPPGLASGRSEKTGRLEVAEETGIVTGRIPFLGRDASSDSRARKEYQARLERLVREIKEADDARDTETADKLRQEFETLTEHYQSEGGGKNRGHKKECGNPSPAQKANQSLRVALTNLKDRFRRKGLPKLADHLDKYLGNAAGRWWYAPPPGTSWHISFPNPPEE
jgi:hypothetical protein